MGGSQDDFGGGGFSNLFGPGGMGGFGGGRPMGGMNLALLLLTAVDAAAAAVATAECSMVKISSACQSLLSSALLFFLVPYLIQDVRDAHSQNTSVWNALMQMLSCTHALLLSLKSCMTARIQCKQCSHTFSLMPLHGTQS